MDFEVQSPHLNLEGLTVNVYSTKALHFESEAHRDYPSKKDVFDNHVASCELKRKKKTDGTYACVDKLANLDRVLETLACPVKAKAYEKMENSSMTLTEKDIALEMLGCEGGILTVKPLTVQIVLHRPIPKEEGKNLEILNHLSLLGGDISIIQGRRDSAARFNLIFEQKQQTLKVATTDDTSKPESQRLFLTSVESD